MRLSSPFLRAGVALVCLAFSFGIAPAAQAAAPEKLGKFSYWTAYRLSEGGRDVCYMSITAKAPDPKGANKKAKRGNVVLMITHRPAENTTDVVSYAAGTKFKPSSDVNVNVGNKQFNLFTQNDTAWSRDAATDHALTLALRSAASLAISGTSAQNAPIADTVALKGADAAYQAMSKACKVPVPALAKEAPAPKEKAKKPATAKPAVAKPAHPATPSVKKPRKAAPKGDVPSSADLKKILSQ